LALFKGSNEEVSKISAELIHINKKYFEKPSIHLCSVLNPSSRRGKADASFSNDNSHLHYFYNYFDSYNHGYFYFISKPYLIFSKRGFL